MVVGFALFALVGCGDSGAVAPTTAVDPPETSTGAPSSIQIAFDGETCSYAGPSSVSMTEPISVEMSNSSEGTVRGHIVWIQEEDAPAARDTVGTDFPWETVGPLPMFYLEVSPGAQDVASTRIAAPGLYIVECISVEGAALQRVWRPAAFEAAP